MSLIKIENLTLSYEGRRVIENLSFRVNKGDYLCIIGENGSGKTSVIKAILGLITPEMGNIIYENNLKKNEIGYLPQQTEIQKNFPASVYEVVLSGCQKSLKKFPFYNKNSKRIALNNIEKLKLNSIKDKCYNELSGGQQQRVLLARALCATDKIIILDEPVSGLDPVITNDLYNIIYEMNRKEKITVIMISHDINSVSKYATKILHIRENDYTYEDMLLSDSAISGGEKNA